MNNLILTAIEEILKFIGLVSGIVILGKKVSSDIAKVMLTKVTEIPFGSEQVKKLVEGAEKVTNDIEKLEECCKTNEAEIRTIKDDFRNLSKDFLSILIKK